MEVEQILFDNRLTNVDNSVDNLVDKTVGKYSLPIRCYEEFLGLGLNNGKGKVFSYKVGIQKQK
jgi:hypothetical protein